MGIQPANVQQLKRVVDALGRRRRCSEGCTVDIASSKGGLPVQLVFLPCDAHKRFLCYEQEDLALAEFLCFTRSTKMILWLLRWTDVAMSSAGVP
jgi:hypothetical protein